MLITKKWLKNTKKLKKYEAEAATVTDAMRSF
jgi:hypothetical protein